MLLTVIALQAAVAAPVSFDIAAIGRSAPAHDRSYRITPETDQTPENHHRALQLLNRDCGVTGMPVCPRDGRQVFRAGF